MRYNNISSIDEFSAYIDKYVVETSSLCMALDMIEMTHEDMIRRANHKLTCESGTYEDAVYLYEEVNKETATKQEGIITKILKAIGDALTKIKEFLFGKSDGDKETNIDKAKEAVQEAKQEDKEVPDFGEEVPANFVKVEKGVIADFKAWINRGLTGDIPESISNYAKKGAVIAAVGTGAALTWDTVTGILNYVGGDSSTLTNLKNKLDDMSEKETDDGKKTILATAANLMSKIVSIHSSTINKVIGTIFKFVGTSGAKSQGKKSDAIDKKIKGLEDAKAKLDPDKDADKIKKIDKAIDELKEKQGKVKEKIDKANNLASGAAATKDVNIVVDRATGNYYKKKVDAFVKKPGSTDGKALIEELNNALNTIEKSSNKISGSEYEKSKKALKEYISQVSEAQDKRVGSADTAEDSKSKKGKPSGGINADDVADILNDKDDKDDKGIEDHEYHGEINFDDPRNDETTNESWFDFNVDNWTSFTFESSEDLDSELLDLIDEL